MDRRERLRRARLYFICDGKPGGRPLLDVLVPALAGGVDVFQLRDKHAERDQVLVLAEAAQSACQHAGALFIINDRPDLVAETGADGVHVGQDDSAIADARLVVGDELLIGISTHAPADLAASTGADYAGVGPVHATPTKPGRPATGLDYVRYAASNAAIPFFAIGGIDAANAKAVQAAGAQRLAVVRAIALAQDPAAAASELRATIESEAVSAAR